MANTLTNLIPDVYAALDVVSRELSGFIPASTWDAQSTRAAVGQTVRVPVAPAAVAEDLTPGSTPPNTGDQDIGNTPIVITKARGVPFRWTGEEQVGVNHGPGYLTIRQAQIAQAMRTLINEIEADIGATYVRASRAHGTAGTTPFGTSTKSIDDAADVLKILKDNGAPSGDLQLVIDTAASTNLRKVSNLQKVNEAGEMAFLRQGSLGNLFGFDVRESAGVALHTKGTGANYVTDGSVAAGVSDVALITGTGTVLAGDIVTFAADSTNKYVVGTGVTAPGTISLNKPGARITIPNGNALTVGGNFRANLAFSRSALILATRAPAIPEEGDQADDATLIVDPRTGLTFEVRMYREYRRVRYEVCAAWGTANIKPEHTAILLG